MECYLRLGKLQNAHQKVLIFWIEIETDYVIARLKILLQNHDLFAMFHSKTTKKKSQSEQNSASGGDTYSFPSALYKEVRWSPPFGMPAAQTPTGLSFPRRL